MLVEHYCFVYVFTWVNIVKLHQFFLYFHFIFNDCQISLTLVLYCFNFFFTFYNSVIGFLFTLTLSNNSVNSLIDSSFLWAIKNFLSSNANLIWYFFSSSSLRFSNLCNRLFSSLSFLLSSFFSIFSVLLLSFSLSSFSFFNLDRKGNQRVK